MKFTVLGAGSWGTAVAIHIARKGHSVSLYSRREEQALSLNKDKENKKYMEGIPFPDGLTATSDMQTALKDCDVVFLACPSQGIRQLCENIRSSLSSAGNIKAFISLCKGLEQDTKQSPVSILKEILPDEFCGVLSGPNYAKEVALGKPAASVLAFSEESPFAREIQEALSDNSLRIYLSNDLLGVELGSCLKNVYAIGSGICDGLELGDNAKATLLTRAMNELLKLGIQLGGSEKTFYGLSGFGDLVATCFGKWSRNRTFGEEFARGGSAETLIKNKNKIVEGYWAIHSFYNLLKEQHIEAPILNELYAILYENRDIKKSIQTLMTRELKSEY